MGHALNLAVSTAALGLQVAAYRLFVLPSAPIRFSDIQHLSMAMKILLVGYAADLLFSSDLNPEVSSTSIVVAVETGDRRAWR